MIQYNFPIYTSHDDGTRLVKHINHSKCIMVYIDRIEMLNFQGRFDLSKSLTTNYWDELQNKKAFQVSKELFDMCRQETINQLINY